MCEEAEFKIFGCGESYLYTRNLLRCRQPYENYGNIFLLLNLRRSFYAVYIMEC